MLPAIPKRTLVVLVVAVLCSVAAAPVIRTATDGPSTRILRVVATPVPTPTPTPKPTPEPTPEPPSGVPKDPAFWRRLANCESASGASTKHYVGYFQFSRNDTADKVGIDGSESYETQRSAAMHWASQVSPGSTAGWPHCWWVAQR